MESIRVLLNDAPEFDKTVHGGPPEAGDLTFITKDNATNEGNPAVAITFHIRIPGGQLIAVQSVTTLRNLMGALNTLKARYPHLME